MDKKASNFAVGSKGYCFLCLNKISTVIPDGARNISDFAVYSLQDVARYLKVDMRKAFIAGGPIPPHLLSKVEKSRLTVELCEGCSSMTENISKLCQQLEKLKLEIESGLESIHEKMSEAEETGRAKQFRSVMGSELVSGMGGGMEIMEALRLETMQKCSQKISSASPRLQIQRLTSEEAQPRARRSHKKELIRSEQFSESMDDNIATEEPDNVNWAVELEDDFHNENSIMNDLDNLTSDDSISAIAKVNSKTEVATVTVNEAIQMREETTGRNPQQKWIINPKTGKYKCMLCPVEYATRQGVHYHYDTVHHKIRFKCKICGKLFTRQGDYKRHHESVHLGIRFQCQVCKKTFSDKGYLLKHQRKTGCAIKVEPRVN